jgi:hypothetical protein
MGNTTAPAEPPSLNSKLSSAPVTLLSSPSSVQSPVLFAYSASRDGIFRVVVVHRRGVDAYDPVTGSRLPSSFVVRDRNYIMKAGRCDESSREDVLILADVCGTFTLRQAYNLEVVEEFGSAEHKYISAFICPLPDLIFAGYLSGDLRVFEFGNSQAKFKVQASELGTAVRSLAYSKQHKLLFMGFDNSYESHDGTYVKLAMNPILVYSMSSIATQPRTQPVKSLDGLESGSCSALELVEASNLAVAASAVNGVILIWDFITGTRLLKLNPSEAIKSAVLLSTLAVVPVSKTRQIITVGFNDCSILTSELVFNRASRSFSWLPNQLIKPKSSSLDSNLGITSILHDTALDILMIGTDLAQVRLINNFKAEYVAQEALPMQLEPAAPRKEEVKTQPAAQAKTVSEEALQKIRDRVEGKRKKTEKLSGFSRFLAEKKPEMLASNPELSMKEVVMQVSAVWGELDEAARLSYE